MDFIYKYIEYNKLARTSAILFIIFLDVGCAKLQHLDQLLTLKALSDEGRVMGKYVEAQDRKFDLLLAAVRDDQLPKYKTKASVVKAFGDPAYTKTVTENHQPLELAVYRYTKGSFDSDKVFFYFNARGDLLRFEFKPAKK